MPGDGCVRPAKNASGYVNLTCWRDRNQEVAFVMRQGNRLVALEVQSGRGKDSLPGMEAFARQFKPKRKRLVGGQGIPLEEFLSQPAECWLP